MEAAADFKSEYYQGKIIALPGVSPNHSTICFNLCWCVGNTISDKKDCFGFESSLKLEIASADAYVYPDLMVVCGQVELAENTSDVITNPMLIIEVLSPSTESFDRGLKFEYYRSLPSLKEYVLVSQDKPKIETYFKQNRNSRTYTIVEGLNKTLMFQSLEYEIALKEIYLRIF
ncbi:MAG: Uma2 family endonuclease [Desulfobacteraceae bacterium]|nr:Uma2 family endonuclease [Desulfobacteraceae bacterium]